MSDCVPDHLGDTVESDGRDELELAEILWQKGPVFRRLESPPNITEEEDPLELFVREGELASWLHQDDNYNNTNGRTPPNATTSGFDQTPNINPSVAEAEEVCASAPPPLLVDSTPVVAESSSNPALRWIPHNSGACSGSSGGSSDRGPVRERDHRKRKSRQLEQSDDEAAEYDSFEKRKDAPKPPRRTRTAEVHNLSERRRRDRINEKMKALQQLIPRCNKTDKASMLDDAVEYLKFLQLQVQMMSMGCTMPAMTFPPFGQSPQVGMFMEMGTEPNTSHMGCPMLPFPPWMQASPAAGTSAAAAAHLGEGMPMQPFHPAAMFVNPQLAARQAGQLPDSMSNVFPMQGQNPQLMNMSGHPFNYFGLQQMQQQHMNQVAMEDKKFCKSSSERHT